MGMRMLAVGCGGRKHADGSTSVLLLGVVSNFTVPRRLATSLTSRSKSADLG